MLAALLGSDPSQHWEHITVYTQHTPEPPETACPEAASDFTMAHKDHQGPEVLPACGDTFMCHWLPPHGHHHLCSARQAEIVVRNR
ncbi:hypothetical protein VZT92_020936 [Zoarces viviparus]|uniref:Uncharacterized protein n=1 Tax=Zoarces viviparus TaxID=48416 RepID=A0AAW1EEZ2_ZOAVI